MALALEIVLVISAILMTIFVLLHKGKGGGPVSYTHLTLPTKA